MQGRIEHKRVIESKLLDKIKGSEMLNKYYYSLSSKSHTTKARYLGNVIRFLEYRFCKDATKIQISELQYINDYDINQYIEEIKFFEKNGQISELSSSTKACIYSSLSSFFGYLSKFKLIQENPFDNHKIERPKIQEHDVLFLTPEEVKKVENTIIKGVGNATAIGKQKDWKMRDYLLFRIPVVTGLRVTALAEIDIEDLDLKNHQIKVTEKGNVSKRIYIDEQTEMFINMWLSKRKELLGYSDCKALFISNRRERMTVKSIERIIQKYTQPITDKHITPHKLRSTCGTNLYQAKKDIYLVAEVLGHKSTSPTKRYTKVFDRDKQEAIKTVADLYK